MERNHFIVLNFSLSLTLKVLACLIILGNTKTNGFITLSKYPIKYLESFFVSTNFEMNILLPSASKTFLDFLAQKVLLLLLFSHQISTLPYYQKSFCLIFYLIYRKIFLRIYYSSSNFDLC